MVSLWGTKNDDDDDRLESQDGETTPTNAGDSRQIPRRSGGDDADERTRLLPPRREGFLSPDDPAVSPYNLWSVRALRYLSIIFLVITLMWWVLLLISTFVSPPLMHSRGSGFFDFSYTTLAAGILLVSLLFFSVPSKPMEIASLVIAGFLLLDMIIILAVGRLRLEEGWVGIASVIWATLMALYTVLTDRVVNWGKGEEEERLTGRKETRRSFKEWCAVVTESIIMILMVVVVVFLTSTLIIRCRDASLSPPGKRYYVDGDKYQIHLSCVGDVTYDKDGSRNPTVLLEGGEAPVEYTFDDWVWDAYQNGTIDRYCYYDRPGIAWSDNAPSPHSAGMTSDALSEALVRAGEKSPWILVSAGVGGIYSRVFSSRHAQQVTGLMLIDALHEDLLYRLGRSRRGFVLWLRGVISPLGYDRLFGALFQGRGRQDRVYGRSSYQNGKFIKAKLQESLVADSLTKNEITQARNIQSRNTPLVVVSSAQHNRKDRTWQEKQKDLTTVTDKLIGWDVVNGAPHEVWSTLEGRTILEKRLGELIKASKESKPEYGRYLDEAGSQAPSTKHQAPSIKHQAPSTKHQAPSTKHQAPSTKHQAPSTKHQAPSIKHQAPSTEHRAPSTEHRAPSTKHQASSIKHQAPSIKHQASSIKHQASSIKHQASSTKHQAPSIKHQASSIIEAIMLRLT